MKLQELKDEISKYQYFEDTNLIDVSIASIIATRLLLGDPIWLVIIGASSGGKSQILRPLALTDKNFLHRIDDLTENTFLSGMKLKECNPSLLHRIGKKGMLVISDLTVLFSKSTESKTAILSQFRMIYDGEMIKFVGTTDKPLTWQGHLGIIAGSTPTIYHHFEEVADMGERFIYYRMKDFNPEKATQLAMKRELFGKELDIKLSNLYEKYIKEVVKSYDKIELSETTYNKILEIAQFAERVRTPVYMNFKKTAIERIPTPAMPMRVALQLISIAKALTIMRNYENYDLDNRDMEIIDHCGWSLANEEKRTVLRVLANTQYGTYVRTQTIADNIGLATDVTKNILQNLASVNVLERSGESFSLSWRIKKQSEWFIIRRVEKIDEIIEYEERQLTTEEFKDIDDNGDEIFADEINI